jgi:hypothetical protein
VESEHHIGIGQHYFVHCRWIFEAIVRSDLADDLLTEVVSAGGEDGTPANIATEGKGSCRCTTACIGGEGSPSWPTSPKGFEKLGCILVTRPAFSTCPGSSTPAVSQTDRWNSTWPRTVTNDL